MPYCLTVLAACRGKSLFIYSLCCKWTILEFMPFAKQSLFSLSHCYMCEVSFFLKTFFLFFFFCFSEVLFQNWRCVSFARVLRIICANMQGYNIPYMHRYFLTTLYIIERNMYVKDLFVHCDNWRRAWCFISVWPFIIYSHSI